MSQFQIHPDNLIYVRTPSVLYVDSPENFKTDFGIDIPSLPDGADEMVYDQGKRHCYMGDGDIVGGGPMPWADGDAIIDAVQTGVAAKAARIAAIPPLVIPDLGKFVSIVGLVRFTVTAAALTTTADTVGIDSVTRISAGRYRIYYLDPDDDLALLPAPVVRDAADIRARVSAKTSAYTEIKAVNAAGAATDAAEITVTMSKVT